VDGKGVSVFSKAARSLVGASALEMVSPTGELVEIWTISSQGDVVDASASRLLVAEGMTLSCRLAIDGLPHRVVVNVEAAYVRSQARAGIRLRVVEASVDGYNRQSARVLLSARATLTAVACERLVPGEPLQVNIGDMSASGIGAIVHDHRPRVGDRMNLYCRFLEGEVKCDVRIVRKTQREADTHVGCNYLALPASTEAVVLRVLNRLSTVSTAAGNADIRRSLMPVEQQKGVRRRLPAFAMGRPSPTA
jgi:PilZ domain-containing protein